MNNYPSIFNDVIGPVMRGPSSSHCAASLRIGRLCRDLMDAKISRVLVQFDPNGSLATTHQSQGSDMGLFGGFLGWEADEQRLPESARFLQTAGIACDIDIVDIGASHPNTYRILLSSPEDAHRLTAISTGGGMIEVIDIDGAKLSMYGDFFETLIYCREPAAVISLLENSFEFDQIILHQGEAKFVQVKAQGFVPDNICEELRAVDGQIQIRKLSPVLPVMSRKDLDVPFITAREMMAFNKGRDLELWELALAYESQRGNISASVVFEKMRAIVRIMKGSIDLGLKGTEYADRLLGSQSVLFKEQMDKSRLIGGEINNRIIMYVSAMMEVKSSMGVIVAAPTAGSCGALPGALLGFADCIDLPEEQTVRGMLSAGLIGVFITAHATFAAEVGGCMAECGSGSGMAAAALAGMAGGNLEQSLAAASLALQNTLGLICDPIANRVEAPCLGRNVMAATNAVSCANMALSGYNHLIPLDEVIETMQLVGNEIHHSLRCTNLGGLSITHAAKQLEENLGERSRPFYKIC